MTSLELQLKRLKTDASAQSLSAQRDYSSLLFDEKEAANYTREQFYDIGLSGLSHLCKLDPNFDSYEVELFEKEKLNFNRGLLNNDENNKLNESLERIIIRLSSYFHHFSCKQVLEWLVHKYRVHAYNAELLAIAFLPYCTSNSYGRLLKILRFQNPEWSFVEEYAKNALPIPINVLVKVCFADNSFFLLPAFSNYLTNAIKLVGEEFVAQHLQSTFTFFAQLIIALFENQAKINNQLISRVMPYVGIALKSKVLPFKCAGMMIVTKIVASTQLNEEVLSNILKLILLKVKKIWIDIALDTAIAICQNQNVNSFSKKAAVKLIHNSEELGLIKKLLKRMSNYDISLFLNAYWCTLFGVLHNETDKEEWKVINKFMIDVLDLEKMDCENATVFFNQFLQFISEAKDREEFIEEKLLVSLRKHMHAIVIRFPNEFDVIRGEWMVRDKNALDQLMNLCQIELHEVGEMSIKKPRRRRTSSCGSRKSFSLNQDSSFLSEIYNDVENNLTAEEKIKNAQSQIMKHQKPFRKSITKLSAMLEEKTDNTTIEWALHALSDPNYLNKQDKIELEDFFIKAVFFASQNQKFVLKSNLIAALCVINIDPEVIHVLLSDLTSFEPIKKRSKFAAQSIEEKIANIFVGETCDQCQRRILFTLEVLNMVSTANFAPFSNSTMIRKLFQLIEKEQCIIMNNSGSVSITEKNASSNLQQLALGLVVKILEKLSTPYADSFILDLLVKLIRFAHSPNILPNALKVLTLVAPVLPSESVSQFMSVFTFMGNGIIKRDNEMTLKIFEETLCALFGALLKTDMDKTPAKNGIKTSLDFQQRLSEISKIFSASLMDIPAHRRMRILRVVLSTIPREYVWIVLSVLFENFCSRWEKAKTGSNGENKEHLDDVLLDPLLNFFDSFSL